MRHLPTPKGLRAKKAPRCPLCNRRLRRKAKRCAFCTFTVAAQDAQKQAASERAAVRRTKRAAKTQVHLEAITWFVEDATTRQTILDWFVQDAIGQLGTQHEEALGDNECYDTTAELAALEDLAAEIGETETAPRQDEGAASPA